VAQASTILQFTEFGFNTPFQLLANVSGTQTLIGAATQVNVTFDSSFCSVAGCSGATDGAYELLLNAFSVGVATVDGQSIEQNFNGFFSLRRGPLNLLTVTFSALFSGQIGSGDPTMNASQPPDTFSSTSDVFDPAKLGIPRGFVLSFTNMSGGGLGLFGNTIRSGVADGTGTITVTPQDVPVPEPTTMALMGSGIAAIVASRRKARQ